MKLLTTPEQFAALREYMLAFNAGANYAAEQGFAAGEFARGPLHRRCYRNIRERFGLSGQTTTGAIAKACAVFARDKSTQTVFKSLGAITYHRSTLTLRQTGSVSLLTLAGRAEVEFAASQRQKDRLVGFKRGYARLILRDGTFYLEIVVQCVEPQAICPADFVGVDLGIANLATSSDAQVFTGAGVERARRKYERERRRLKTAGTRGAKKRLRRTRRKESFFRRHENHCISKQIVASAQGTGRGIGLEDLRGIRERTTVRKKQRARHSGWAFGQLREFVAYKAKLAGVPVVLVDPRNTSRTCSECGHCDKANRKSQSEFLCLHCGYSTNADFNAARNIAFRARAAFASQPQNCQLAAAS